jgi:hypothetical protein
MAAAIKAVPDEIWDAAGHPKLVVVVDDIRLCHALSPTSTEMITGSGLYILPQKEPIHEFTPDGEHVVYISLKDDKVARWRMGSDGEWVPPEDRNHTAEELKNNLLHEIGHAVTMPYVANEDDVPSRARASQLRMYADDIFQNTTKYDRTALVRHISEEEVIADDPWLYPKMTAAGGSTYTAPWELAAEAFTYMATGKRSIVDAADEHADGPLSLDMTEWLDSLFPDGTVPIAKRKSMGFSGWCGVRDFNAVAKHYPGGKDHDQKKHGRRRGGRTSMDQPSLFVDQPSLFSAKPPKKKPPRTVAPLTIKNEYVLGVKTYDDASGMYTGMLTNHDEVNRIKEHIAKDPISALKALGEHQGWLDTMVINPKSFIGGSNRGYRIIDQGDQWTYELDRLDDLMVEAAEKAEPLLIERGYEVKAEIENAMASREEVELMNRPWSITEPTALENYKVWIAENYPEYAARVEDIQNESVLVREKYQKSRNIYQFYRQRQIQRTETMKRVRESGVKPNFEAYNTIPRDKFTQSALDQYDARVKVREALLRHPDFQNFDLTTSQVIRVQDDPMLPGHLPYMEEMEDARLARDYASGRRTAMIEPGDLAPGDFFEGSFRYYPPGSEVYSDRSLKLRRNASIYDEGTPTPLFFSTYPSEAARELHSAHLDDPDSIIVKEDIYTHLLATEGRRLENSSLRAEKKLKGELDIIHAELKQSTGKEQAVLDTLSKHREMGGDISMYGTGKTKAQQQIQLAADAYPADWVERSNEAGPLRVKGKPRVRAFYENQTQRRSRSKKNPGTFWESKITVNPSGTLTDDTLHELGHRMEHVIPEIRHVERVFWKRRTEGESWQSLAVLTGNPAYRGEKTKPDKFGIPYMGKRYGTPTPDLHYGDGFITSSEAFELLSTAYPVITGRSGNKLDPEHEALVLGILTEL